MSHNNNHYNTWFRSSACPSIYKSCCVLTQQGHRHPHHRPSTDPSHNSTSHNNGTNDSPNNNSSVKTSQVQCHLMTPPPLGEYHPIPEPRTDHTTCLHISNHKLLLISGEQKLNAMFHDVWAWTPVLNQWVCLTEAAPLEALFTPRNSVHALIHENRLWVLGGFESRLVSPDYATSIPLTDLNSSQDPLPLQFLTQRFVNMNQCPSELEDGFFGSALELWHKAANETYMVVAFGCSTPWNHDRKLGIVAAYCFETRRWEVWYSPPRAEFVPREEQLRGHTSHGLPLYRYCPLHTLYDDYLYVLGGRTEKLSKPFTDMLRFSLRHKKWELLFDFVPVPLSDEYKTVKSVRVDHTWYICSTGAPSVLYAFDLRTHQFVHKYQLDGFTLKGRFSLDHIPNTESGTVLYAMGGYEEDEFLPTNKIYRIPLPTSSKMVRMSTNMMKNTNFADLVVCCAEEQ